MFVTTFRAIYIIIKKSTYFYPLGVRVEKYYQIGGEAEEGGDPYEKDDFRTGGVYGAADRL